MSDEKLTLSAEEQAVISALEKLNVISLNNVVKYMEQEYGISAAAPVAAAAAGGGAAAAVEKSTFDVELTEAGAQKIQVIKVVKEVSGVDFPVKLSPRRPGDVGSVVAANGRIRSALGWTPKHDDLRSIVEQALAWERRLHNRAG